MSETFAWKRRRHQVACAANIPLLNEMVLMYESAAPSAEAVANGAPAKSKMQRAYGKAIQSIAMYPLEITSAEEAQELNGIGDFLASRIGRILKEKLDIQPNLPDRPASSDDSSVPKAKKLKKTDAPNGIVASSVSSGTAAHAPAEVRTASIPAAANPVLPALPSIFSPGTLQQVANLRTSPPPALAASATPSSSLSSLPECPFRERCYRTNPAHFQEQTHPPTHPLVEIYAPEQIVAVAVAPAKRSTKRGHDVVVLLSDEEEDEPAQPSQAKKQKSHSSAALPPTRLKMMVPKRRIDDEDDFIMTDDDNDSDLEDVVDLTSPNPPVVPASASLPAAAASSASPSHIAPSPDLPPPHPVQASPSVWTLPQAPALPKKTDSKSEKMYKPKQGTSAYALLLALSQSSIAVSKSQLLGSALAHYPAEKAQAPDAKTSLWSGMSNLVTRDLVNRTLTPIQYEITEQGRATVKAMLPQAIPPLLRSPLDDFLTPSPAPIAAAASPAIAASIIPTSSAPIRAASSPVLAQPITLARRFCNSAEWEVVLLIDLRERSGRKDSAYMIEKLSKHGLICDARALSVGDFMFLARHTANKSMEVVLDTIIERKRISDLVLSIRDGRYHEQKSRLKKTKLTRMIYVIEGRIAEDTVHGLPLKTVENVLISMNGVHGLLVHHTPAIETTISFLESLYHLLQSELQSTGVPIILPEDVHHQPLSSQQQLPNLAELPSVPPSMFGPGESFTSFSVRLHKSTNLLAAELFGTQLRMIRGVSAALALNIIAKYPSARALCDAYDRCKSEEEEENMLENISRGPFQSVGKGYMSNLIVEMM